MAAVNCGTCADKVISRRSSKMLLKKDQEACLLSRQLRNVFYRSILAGSVSTILMLNFVRSAFKTIQGTSLSPCQVEVLHLALLYARRSIQ